MGCVSSKSNMCLHQGGLPVSKATQALHLPACSSETGSVSPPFGTPSAAGEGRNHGGLNYLSSLKPGFLWALQVGVCTHSPEHCGMLAVTRDQGVSLQILQF